MTGKMYEQTAVQNHLDSYKMYIKCPPPTRSAAKSFSTDLSLDAPVRPCTPLYAPVSKHDLLEEPGAGACHIIFREFRYLSMHILLGMIR